MIVMMSLMIVIIMMIVVTTVRKWRRSVVFLFIDPFSIKKGVLGAWKDWRLWVRRTKHGSRFFPSACKYSQNMKNASFELASNVNFTAEGFFAAVGTEDWLDGFACGTCAEVSYR